MVGIMLLGLHDTSNAEYEGKPASIVIYDKCDHNSDYSSGHHHLKDGGVALKAALGNWCAFDRDCSYQIIPIIGNGQESKAKALPVASPSTSGKPICRYGSSCYRTNPKHLVNFSHPKSPLGVSSNDDMSCNVITVSFKVYSIDIVNNDTLPHDMLNMRASNEEVKQQDTRETDGSFNHRKDTLTSADDTKLLIAKTSKKSKNLGRTVRSTNWILILLAARRVWRSVMMATRRIPILQLVQFEVKKSPKNPINQPMELRSLAKNRNQPRN
jgi:hypothetical protein